MSNSNADPPNAKAYDPALLPGEPSDMAPGDEAPPGAPNAGETVCPDCNGSGRTRGGERCPTCEGSGSIVQAIGGA